MSISLPSKYYLNEDLTKGGIVPKSQLNTSARMINNIKSFSGVSVDTNPYGIELSSVETDHPFRVVAIATNTISVTQGSWVRNQTSANISGNTTSGVITSEDLSDHFNIEYTNFCNKGVKEEPVDGETYYVFVELASNNAPDTIIIDPAIAPAKLELRVDRDRDEASARTYEETVDKFSNAASDPSLFAKEFRNVFVKTSEVIATVVIKDSNISSINQYIKDNICDYAIVPDTYFATREMARTTIDFNPIVNYYVGTVDEGKPIHYGELEIANVWQCANKGTWSLPSFFSATDRNLDNGPEGYLSWLALDTFYNVFQKTPPTNIGTNTISMRVDPDTSKKPIEDEEWSALSNSFKLISLTNCEYTKEWSHSVPMFLATEKTAYGETQGTLQWAAADSNLYEPESGFDHYVGVYKSIEMKELGDDKNFSMGLYQFNQTVNENMDSSQDYFIYKKVTPTESHVSYRRISDFSVAYADHANTAGHSDTSDDAGHATWADYTNNFSHTHSQHTNFEDDSHNGSPTSRIAMPYVSPRNIGSARSGNMFEQYVGLYDQYGKLSVMPNERYLCHDGSNWGADIPRIAVDYYNYWLGYNEPDEFGSHQYHTLNWYDQELQTDSVPDVGWAADIHMLYGSWNVEVNANVGGDAFVTGICHANQLQINSDAYNYWNTSNFSANVSSAVTITSPDYNLYVYGSAGVGLFLDTTGTTITGDLFLDVDKDTSVGEFVLTTDLTGTLYLSDDDGNMKSVSLLRGGVKVNTP